MTQAIKFSIICVNHALNANNFAAITRAKSMHRTGQCHAHIEVVIRNLNGDYAIVFQADIFGIQLIDAALNLDAAMMHRGRRRNGSYMMVRRRNGSYMMVRRRNRRSVMVRRRNRRSVMMRGRNGDRRMMRAVMRAFRTMMISGRAVMRAFRTMMISGGTRTVMTFRTMMIIAIGTAMRNIAANCIMRSAAIPWNGFR